MEQSSLNRWRLRFKQNKHSWVQFYSEMLGVGPSNIPRFYRAINLYGDIPVIEAIIISSDRGLEGDPFGYVLSVANAKWKELQLSKDEDDDYAKHIEEAKRNTLLRNKELEKKLKRRRKR